MFKNINLEDTHFKMSSKRQVNQLAKQILTFCKKFDAIQNEAISLQRLKVRLEELERRFVSLKTAYEKYLNEEDEIEADDGAVAEAVQTKKFEEASKAYMEMKVLILIKIEDQTSQLVNAEINESDNSNMSTSFNHNTQALRLPTINIPIFEGGYFKWPPFTDLFVGIFQNLT